MPGDSIHTHPLTRGEVDQTATGGEIGQWNSGEHKVPTPPRHLSLVAWGRQAWHSSLELWKSAEEANCSRGEEMASSSTGNSQYASREGRLEAGATASPHDKGKTGGWDQIEGAPLAMGDVQYINPTQEGGSEPRWYPAWREWTKAAGTGQAEEAEHRWDPEMLEMPGEWLGYHGLVRGNL